MMRFGLSLLALATASGLWTESDDANLVLLQLRASKIHEDAEQRPENMCQSGIRVFNICYDRSCGRTGQRPGGRNCGSLPGGANACCRSRLTRRCTGPNMDRCRIAGAGSMGMGMMMGKMGMGKMGMMMGKMGMMGMMMGGGGGDDEAEAVGDPHITTNTGHKFDLELMQKHNSNFGDALLDEEVKGNALTRRATPDGATNIEFVDRGAGPFGEDGVLSSVRFYAQAAGNKGLQFRVYRPQGGGFTLVGATEQVNVPSANTVQTVSFSQPVEFQAGDYIGWSHTSNGNIPFDGNGGRVSWNYNKNNAVGTYVGFGAGGSRTYSYEVNTEPKTTTTAAPVVDEEGDEGAAVGDPHMTTNTGKHFDLERH